MNKGQTAVDNFAVSKPTWEIMKISWEIMDFISDIILKAFFAHFMKRTVDNC